MNTSANGRKPPPPLDMAAIKTTRKELRVRIKLAQEKRLLESLLMYDEFGGSDLWDRVRPQTQEDRAGWVPVSIPSDRRHGSNWPIWRNDFELSRYRQESRVRGETNSFAVGLLKNLTNTVVGKGYAYKVKALGPDGNPLTSDQSETDDSLAVAVQKVIDHFLKINHWNGTISPLDFTAIGGTREREVYRTVKLDGECFLRFHRQRDGTVKVRIIDASQIRSKGDIARDGWSYGIKHQMDPFEDVETPVAYSVLWPDPSAKGGEGDSKSDLGTEDIVDADEVLHLKGMDTPSNVKRGLGLFLFDVGAALDRAAKLQRNASIGAAIRAAIAETWQYDTATQQQLQSFADALAESSSTDAVSGQRTNNERVYPGMIRRGTAGASLVQPSADNTPAFLTAVQGDLQQGCAGAGVASFVIGDVSSGNYSNYESASFPPVQNAACEQEYFKSAFARAVWKAVEWAVECGTLPQDALTRVTITVEAPAVLHRNELEKAQEDQIGVHTGWKDRQTCSAERGLEWETVEANNTEYADAHPQPTPGEEGEGGGSDDTAFHTPQQPGNEQSPFKMPSRSAAAKKGWAKRRGVSAHESYWPDAPDTLYEKLTELRETYGEGLTEEIAGAARLLLETKDAAGHQHKGKGDGGGQFTGGGSGGENGLFDDHSSDKQPAHKERANTLSAKKEELKQELKQQLKQMRHDGFNAVKADAVKAKDAAASLGKTINDHVDNIGWLSDREDEPDSPEKLDDDASEEERAQYTAGMAEYDKAFAKWEAGPDDNALELHQNIEALARTLPGGGDDEDLTPAEQFERLGEIIDTAKEMQAVDWTPTGQFSPEELAGNKERLAGLIKDAKQARTHLRQYSQHRKEMGAIRRGEVMEAREAACEIE